MKLREAIKKLQKNEGRINYKIFIARCNLWGGIRREKILQMNQNTVSKHGFLSYY